MGKRAGLTRRSFVGLSGGAAAALGLALAGCGTQQAPQKDEGQKEAPSSGTTIGNCVWTRQGHGRGFRTHLVRHPLCQGPGRRPPLAGTGRAGRLERGA
ncbi:MAG: twin-arginine translocation signal domain-containing protein [Atopobiaceae bacterium]|nr:twin-arginine translocation signal domain-containing protein [Atopobiaceae bacterium]MCI2051311.1 twin-arginine translocation signal domain-containing protein [Atopobiaceae bacterium]